MQRGSLRVYVCVCAYICSEGSVLCKGAICVCVCLYVFVCVYICSEGSVLCKGAVCVCVCVCMCLCVCVCVYICSEGSVLCKGAAAEDGAWSFGPLANFPAPFIQAQHRSSQEKGQDP